MRIILNGESRDLNETTKSIADLVGELGLEGSLIAIEKNRDIVRKDNYAATAIAADDEIEIVHFVGGG